MRCTKNRSEKLTVRLHSQIHAFISFAFIIPLVCIFFFQKHKLNKGEVDVPYQREART